MNLKKLNSLDTFRITSVVALVFVSILVLLSLTGLRMSSRLQVTPQFFIDPRFLGESSQRTMIYSLKDTSGRHEQGQKIIDEMLIRQYLQMRYEQIPDLPEMAFRWGRGGVVYMLSTPKVYGEFAKKIQATLQSLPDMVRVIEVKNVERRKTSTGKDANSFLIKVTLHEQYPDGRIVSKNKSIDVDFGYYRINRVFSPYLTNPYGLSVKKFTESDVKSEKD